MAILMYVKTLHMIQLTCTIVCYFHISDTGDNFRMVLAHYYINLCNLDDVTITS